MSNLSYQRRLIPAVNEVVDSYADIQFNQTIKESLYLEVMCKEYVTRDTIRDLVNSTYNNLLLFAKSITGLDTIPLEPHYDTIDDLIKDCNDKKLIEVK